MINGPPKWRHHWTASKECPADRCRDKSRVFFSRSFWGSHSFIHKRKSQHPPGGAPEAPYKGWTLRLRQRRGNISPSGVPASIYLGYANRHINIKKKRRKERERDPVKGAEHIHKYISTLVLLLFHIYSFIQYRYIANNRPVRDLTHPVKELHVMRIDTAPALVSLSLCLAALWENVMNT